MVSTLSKRSRCHDEVQGAHSEPPFNLLRTGMYTWKSEKKNELAERANQLQTGQVPRHKVSAIRAETERASFFVVAYPGMRGFLSGVLAGGAM